MEYLAKILLVLALGVAVLIVAFGIVLANAGLSNRLKDHPNKGALYFLFFVLECLALGTLAYNLIQPYLAEI